ncbi:MAG TPA: hypothetical protein VGW38_11025, partial [Chloroflexota bacterium]|nr:hypothetical protein [Chloroflexota bacterium]
MLAPVDAILDYASFPVFVLDPSTAAGRRLRPRSRSRTNYGWSPGEPARAGLSSVSLAYVGPDYDEPQESVLVQSVDPATEPVQPLPERHRLQHSAMLLES